MQLLGIAHGRPGFRAHQFDRRGVESAGRLGLLCGKRTAHLHHASAALFQRRIVEIGVWVGVENLVRERRGLGRIDRRGTDRAIGESLQQPAQASEIHRFIEAVVDGLLHQRMIGNAHLAREIFGTRRLVGEDSGHQVVGAHALDGRRHLAPAGIPWNR